MSIKEFTNSFAVSVVLLCLVSACNSFVPHKTSYIGITENEFSCEFGNLTDSIMDEIDIESLKYSPSLLENTGKLTIRWIQDSSIHNLTYGGKLISYPTDIGWVIYNVKNSFLIHINPANGNELQHNNFKYFNLVNFHSNKIKFFSAPHLALSDNYLLYHIGWKTCIYNIKSGNQAYVVENLMQAQKKYSIIGDKLYISRMVSLDNKLTMIVLDDGTILTIDKEHDNIYNINNNIWYSCDNIIYRLDNQSLEVEKNINIEDNINTDKNLKIFDTDQYGDFILGCIFGEKYNSEHFETNRHIGYYNPFSLTTDKYIPSDIKSYFLFNPESPDKVAYLDEKMLGSMDAHVKVLGSHFIVENDEVLKCIDPFKGEDIWWIDREDVGQEAKILWADERGVLVYSYTQQKLYCFE